ncbi:MAG: FAD-dependent oxidoreductase [Alteromonadaceae bacterium]|jgi:predicted NAD/FAD-binding protein|uniref:NAD(P)/FAD-dependent oxidoreductase n=1 Tax=Rheinheimera aquimaris TaxID=412437 RepID=UPI000C45F23E|nr:FAD-dependent oxidoreductase [Rheinheimera aquimaris]MBJ92082.1 FAD-dependent oxidoreductase [Alteromonadaceae bacterium]HBN88342.1 FAD-dependent oxidoreductase [Rheinheimera sp.]|tara:strand:+ start:8036 stop:9292 length:1257 start_codon:yes stop_codon:yes gene_type:complete
MRIAVVGGGISGMMSWYLLQQKHDVTLFEANDYLGGHTATVQVNVAGQDYAIDTGFIVFNDWTYPIFNRFLSELGVAFQPTEMSFSVKNSAQNLEYNGNTLTSLFAQRRNLLRPSFWLMLRDIVRFNRLGKQLLASNDADLDLALGDFLAKHGFGAAIRDNYLLPMGAAIWSAGLADMPAFPLRFFLRFFNNHGLLNISNRPQWSVISGGSKRYVDALVTKLGSDKLKLNQRIRAISRDDKGVILSFDDGRTEHFDKLVMACHSDQALALLGESATLQEQQILGSIAYQQNDVVLHTDTRLLPKRKRAWAAWNYNLDANVSDKATLTYNMNLLQGISAPVTFCVTLNNTTAIAKDKILGVYRYAHPVFNHCTLAAQQRRHSINGENNTYFCGAYWYNGFHEDGARSATDVATMLGVSF